MIIRCKFFKCADKGSCSEQNCSGCGGSAYQNCGCDACVNRSYAGDGDVEICQVALDVQESDMEERENKV